MSWAAVGVGLGTAAIGAYGADQAADAQADAAGQAGRISERQYDRTRADLEPYRQAGTVGLDRLMQMLGLGSQYSLNDPAVKSTYDKYVADFDAAHRKKYGLSIWDTGVDTVSRDQTLERLKKTAIEKMGSTGTPAEGFGSLLEPFDNSKFEESPAYQFNLSEGMEAINKSAAAKGRYYAPATLQDIGKFSQGLASNEFQNAFNNYRATQDDQFSRLFGVANSGQNAAAQTGTFGAQAAGQMGDAAMGAGNARASGIVGATNAVTGGAADAYNNYLLSQVLGQRQQPTYGGNTPGSWQG